MTNLTLKKIEKKQAKKCLEKASNFAKIAEVTRNFLSAQNHWATYILTNLN